MLQWAVPGPQLHKGAHARGRGVARNPDPSQVRCGKKVSQATVVPLNKPQALDFLQKKGWRCRGTRSAGGQVQLQRAVWDTTELGTVQQEHTHLLLYRVPVRQAQNPACCCCSLSIP